MTTANGPATVDAGTLRNLLATGRGPRMLDVRTPAEFETAHIPGSYNVPLDLLREHGTELRTHLDDEVVLVCRSGARATRAEQTLTQAGLPNVKILDGGMLAWQAAGAPVNRGRPRWDLERQVRLLAGSIVLASVLGSLVVPGLQWLAALTSREHELIQLHGRAPALGRIRKCRREKGQEIRRIRDRIQVNGLWPVHNDRPDP